jgi:hypothetical protein
VRSASTIPSFGWAPNGVSVDRRRLRVAALAAAVLLVTLVGAAPGVAPSAMAAGGDGIDIRTVSTYTLVPERGVVRVVIDLTARNTTPDVTTAAGTTRYYFVKVHVALQPEAVAIRATSGGAGLATAIAKRSGFQEVEVGLRARLYFGRSAAVRIGYDLPGGQPRTSSGIRVGRAFATFVAWANGDRAAVRIVMPSTFSPKVTGGPMATRTAGGRTVLSADDISDTPGWYARVDADRRSALTSHDLTIAPGQRISVRAWPEDPVWLSRVSDRLARGMPVLDALIGLTWPVDGPLEVDEVHTPLLEGYAGIYHADSRGIEISEDLDDLTVLHEASHAWFNGGLFDGRWINEGLADTYATAALGRIGIFSESPVPYGRNDPSAFALNDWPPLGRIADDATRQREDYGYQMSYGVVQRIATAAGESGMRAVFAAAADREVPYVGAGPVEHLRATPDWRTFLDYLQERAGSSNAEPEFGWNVVGDEDRRTLAARAAARRAYARLVDDGGGWSPPYAVRGPMSDWRFPAAVAAIGAGEAVLTTRDRIEAEAGPLGLATPTTLRIAYEGAAADLGAASGIATDELGAVMAIRAAADRLAAPRDPLVVVGLIGEVPDRSLAEAKTAFTQDDLVRAVYLADRSASTIQTATDRGLRTTAGVGGSVGLVVIVVLLVAVVRRRREPTHAAGPSEPGAIPGWRPAGTLASQSSPAPAGPNGGVEPPVIEPFDGPPSASA